MDKPFTDTDRLEFMIEYQCWIVWSRDRECCRVFQNTDDGDTEPVTGWGPGLNWLTAREAIDAAIRHTTGE